MTDEQEHKERPKPRVVDKRVSTRADTPEPVRSQAERPPVPEPPSVSDAGDRARRDSPAQAAAGQEVWTPQQEEEMRAVARQIGETPSLEWVVNTAVTLANVAGTKLDLGMVADAQLAIDALAALIDGLGARLGTTEAPLRQTLAQLRMAYAEMVVPPAAGT